MTPLLLLVTLSASTDLATLDQAVARCDRGVASPAFASEAARRSRFLLDTYREQEAIVVARTALAERRRQQREAVRKSGADEEAIALDEASLEDRQRALNDTRMLEDIRRDTIDAMRRHFLAHCPAGQERS